MVKKSRTKRPRKKRPRTKRPRTKRKIRKYLKNGGMESADRSSSSLTRSWVDVAEECYPIQDSINILAQKESDDPNDLFQSACEYFEPEPQIQSPECERSVTDEQARDIEKDELLDNLSRKGYEEALVVKKSKNHSKYSTIMTNYGSKMLEKASSFVSGAVTYVASQFGISMEDMINFSKAIKIQTLFIYIDNYTRGSVTGMMRGTEAKARMFASTIFEISQRFTSHENAERVKKAQVGLNFMEYINDWRADIRNWGYIQTYFLQAIGEVIANGMKATPQAIRNWNSLCSLLKDCEISQEGMGGLAPNQRVLDAAAGTIGQAANLLGLGNQELPALEQ